MNDVTAGQLALLFVSIALFAVGAGLSVSRLWWENNGLRIAAKACLYLGTAAGLGTLVWHSARRGGWYPLEDNFDALIWLGLLLAGFVLYTGRARPLRGLDGFVVPIVVGGGKRSLPEDVRVKLELLGERRFGNGMVYLHYRTRV